MPKVDVMDEQFKSKFLRGSTYSMVGTMLMLVIHFLSMKVLAESMPIEEFGVFALLMVISQGFVVICGLGLALTLVKNLSGDVDREQQQVVTGVILIRTIQLVLLSILVGTLGPILLPRLFSAEIADFVLFLPVMFGLAIYRETLFNVLQGRQQFHWYAVIKVLSAVTRLAAILWLTHVGRLGVQELVWVEVITSATTVTLLLRVSRVMSLIRIEAVHRPTLKRVIGFSAPLYLDDVLKYVYQCVTVLMLGALLAPSSVALYAVAMRLPDAAGRVVTSLIVVFFPSVSELMESGRRDEGRRLMNFSLVLFSAGLSLVSLVTFLFKEEIILVLFSEQYLMAAPVLAMLMFNFLLNCLTRLMSSAAVAAGHSLVPLRVNVITSGITVVASLAFIPTWGIMGAAVAQVTANALAQVLYLIQLNKAQLAVDAGEVAKPLAFGSFIAVLYGLFCHGDPWMRIAGIILYLLLCWFFVPWVRRCAEYGLAFLARFAGQTSRTV